jgi:hypothetical protein
VEELNIGLVGHDRQHSSLSNLLGTAALIETMNEMADKPHCREVPTQRKRAYPIKKSKRKMAQASRKRNR